MIINDRDVMGEHVNGRVHNIIAWAFSVALIGLSVTLVRRRSSLSAGASGPGTAAGGRRPGRSVALEPVRRARLDVHEHVGVGQAGADVVLDVLGDVVRLGDVRSSSTITCRSTWRRLPARRARSLW